MPHLSATSIGVYLGCPAQFKATRIDRRPEPAKPALVVGRALHYAIETVINVWIAIKDVESDPLITTFRDHLQQIARAAYDRLIDEEGPEVTDWGKPGKKNALGWGWAATSALVTAAAALPIVATEVKFSIPLRDRWTIDGFIDAITILDEVVDFKSQTADRESVWRWSPEKAAKERQPAQYGAAFRHLKGKLPSGFLFLVGEKAASPGPVEEYPVSVTPARVAAARLLAHTISYAVDAGHFPRRADCWMKWNGRPEQMTSGRWCPLRKEGGC